MAFGTAARTAARTVARTAARTVRTATAAVRAAVRQPVLAVLVLAAVVALVYAATRLFRREGFKKCKGEKYYDKEQGKCMRRAWCEDKGGAVNGNLCEGRRGGNCKKPKVYNKDTGECEIAKGAKDSKASGKDCREGSYWDSDRVRCMKKSSCNGKFVDQGKDETGITRGMCVLPKDKEKQCADGYSWSADEKACVNKDGKKGTLPAWATKSSCTGDQFWNNKTQKCDTPRPCPSGQTWDKTWLKCKGAGGGGNTTTGVKTTTGVTADGRAWQTTATATTTATTYCNPPYKMIGGKCKLPDTRPGVIVQPSGNDRLDINGCKWDTERLVDGQCRPWSQ